MAGVSIARGREPLHGEVAPTGSHCHISENVGAETGSLSLTAPKNVRHWLNTVSLTHGEQDAVLQLTVRKQNLGFSIILMNTNEKIITSLW